MTFDAVFPPMATPFRAGEIDGAGIRRNVERWMRTRLGGVVALGSNGEAPLLDEDESDRVIDEARQAMSAGRLLIAGTGRESTRATIAACARAARLGADAVLVRTPSYYRGRMTADAFVRHYVAVADASPVPVLLYNYPAVTGVNLAPETVARLSEHSNIAGVKETGSDTAQVAAFVDASRAEFAVIAGSAPTFYAALCVGARGGILAVACVVPEICVSLHEHGRAGRHAEARALQARLTPLARLVTSGHGIPGLKAAMELAGFVGGEPRPPLAPASAGAVAEIRAALAELQSSALVKQ
ncbi:MAG TPA: dihydrodipicolinate synthase family protein [Vicinamibacterales bacterium]|nr:dihydrodipicolinate synthase family protein [Vicinamibacterales bacterium]